MLSLIVDSYIQQSIEHFTWMEMCLKLNISKNELFIIIMTHFFPIPPIPCASPTNLCYLSLSLCNILLLAAAASTVVGPSSNVNYSVRLPTKL